MAEKGVQIISIESPATSAMGVCERCGELSVFWRDGEMGQVYESPAPPVAA